MALKLTRISVHGTSLVVALIMAVFGVALGLLTIPLTAMFFPARDASVSLILALVLPVAQFVAGYIMSVVSIAIFNFIAPAIGGIRLELTRDAEPWADRSA